MKKSRIFMATGGLVLAISAVFATKASKKFAPGIITAYNENGSTIGVRYDAGSAIFTTHSSAGFVPVYMAIYTVSSNTLTGNKVTEQLYKENSTVPVLVKSQAGL